MMLPKEILEDLCMVREIDTVPRGHIRMETKFRYPDGGSIDLFIVDQQENLFPSPTLSDLGQTMMWLGDVQVRPWQSKKRQTFVDDAVKVLGVRQNGGALECGFDPTKDGLEDAIIRLGQACVRVADLMFTRRSNLQVGIAEEVEEILTDASLEYEPNAQLPGRGDGIIIVDFLVTGRRQKSAVLTLGSQYAHSAHTTANEVFRKQYDLHTLRRPEQRVTVYDDRYEDVYKPDDLERLRDVSQVLPLSAYKDVAAVLAA